MKSVSAINPAITENAECLIVKACTPVINQNSGCVVQSRCITMLHFQLLRTLLVAKNSIRRALLTLHLPSLSLKPYGAYTTNHHLCSSGERNGAQMRTKESFGRKICKHWRSCSWQKDTSWDEVTLIGEEIKAVAIQVMLV